MKERDLIEHLETSKNITADFVLELEKVTEEYPYFQAAKVLYLKGLKQNNNYKYNKVLKETAALTTDRAVLFEYINGIYVIEENQAFKFEKDQGSLREKAKTTPIKEALGIGKPLSFRKDEVHSFNEWLQLSKFQPIQRENTSPIASPTRVDLIDRFIENNPSIQPLDKDLKPQKGLKIVLENQGLMTETLAKVYLEQKKYNSAIKAYKILILKYPEKSGFFADQIKKIKLLKTK